MNFVHIALQGRELVADAEGLLGVNFYGDQSTTKSCESKGLVRLRKNLAAYMIKRSQIEARGGRMYDKPLPNLLWIVLTPSAKSVDELIPTN